MWAIFLHYSHDTHKAKTYVNAALLTCVIYFLLATQPALATVLLITNQNGGVPALTTSAFPVQVQNKLFTFNTIKPIEYGLSVKHNDKRKDLWEGNRRLFAVHASTDALSHYLGDESGYSSTFSTYNSKSIFVNIKLSPTYALTSKVEQYHLLGRGFIELSDSTYQLNSSSLSATRLSLGASMRHLANARHQLATSVQLNWSQLNSENGDVLLGGTSFVDGSLDATKMSAPKTFGLSLQSEWQYQSKENWTIHSGLAVQYHLKSSTLSESHYINHKIKSNQANLALFSVLNYKF